MFKSVFAKYITAFMSIIFISFLVLVLLITLMVNSYAVTAKRTLLESTAAATADFLGARISNADTDSAAFSNMIASNADDVKRMMNAMALKGEGVTLLLVDNRGDILYIAANGEVVTSSAEVPLEVIEDVGSGNTESQFKSLEGVFDIPHRYFAAPVFTTDGVSVCGVVFACSASTALDDLLGLMVKTIIIGSVWVMLAALIACYIISERVIAPLRDMGKMAKSFAEGDFNARVRVQGNDEVAELGRAFNNMAGALSQLEMMRNTFMANVSHDLRTPMTTISGTIDNILSGAIPPEKQEYYLGLIRQEVQRLARLVTSLLDISRIQAGDRKFEMKPFDVCEMGRLIVISFEQKIEDKGLDVDFACDRDRMVVVADHDAIYQILYNICDNAVKFSRPGGVLRVSFTEVEGQRVRVSVYNEGEGIAAADIPFVFERFYKGDKSRGLDKGGVGLGMFIAKTIIDAHHEKIWVESEAGKSCCFSFTLSLAPAVRELAGE